MIKVFSKIELSKSLQKQIIEVIREKFVEEKNSEIEFFIDKTIYSGIKIDVDSEITDLTLNARIDKILNLLTNA